MARFEGDPHVDNSFKLFKELNKHGMQMTVIRLHYKYKVSRLEGERNYKRVQSEFDIALDHIEQMKVTQGGYKG